MSSPEKSPTLPPAATEARPLPAFSRSHAAISELPPMSATPPRSAVTRPTASRREMRCCSFLSSVDMLEAAGVKNVRGSDRDYAPGMGIHEMGTARMGRDPKTSVLNGRNQVWDAPNVFVTDGACMTSAAAVNPSLTYMALTARAADFAVGELNRRNL